jgi:phosphatidate cytidylyltransferase
MSEGAKGPDAGGQPQPAGKWGDLGLRLVSALMLGALVLAATYQSAIAFAVLVAIGSVVLSWEWGRIVRGSDFDELLVLHAISVVVGCGLAVYGEYGVALLVLVVGPALKFAVSDDKTAANLGLSLLGVPYIGLPAVALIWLRSDSALGFAAILYLFATVWSVDIFAYVFGRAIGGPKFAPRISPKKTWSGFIGGVTAGAIAGGAAASLLAGSRPLLLAACSLLIGIASQLGDLAESWLKRRSGIKDASNIIPGHGGLFDRVDGLLVGALVAALIAFLLGGGTAPASALLSWGR